MAQKAASSPSQRIQLSQRQVFRAYFPPAEVAVMVQAQAINLPPSRIEQARQQACGFIDRVGGRLGFPRRTIATAQVLYHRFHLFFALGSFRYQDVAVAALLASAKLEDTLKKLNEIQVAAHHVKQYLEGLPNTPLNQQALDEERQGLLGIERLILETISFNFNLHAGSAAFGVAGAPELGRAGGAGCDVFSYAIKLSKRLGLPKEACKLAFRLAVDAHRSLVPLSYPSHTIAAACIYLASFLAPDVFGEVALKPGWTEIVACDINDLEEICHVVLDMLSALASSSGPSSANYVANIAVSPALSLTASPADLPISMTPAIDLIAIKIRLREAANTRPPPPLKTRRLAVNGHRSDTHGALGKNDVSVRFLWTDEADKS